jgi:hypothetical protein
MVIGPGRLWVRSRGLCEPFSFLGPIFRRVRFRSANRLSRSDGSDRRYAGKGWGFTSLGRFGQGECRRRTSSPYSPDSYGLVLRRRPRGIPLRLYLSCHILAKCRWCWNNTRLVPTLRPSASALWDQLQQALMHCTHPIQGFSQDKFSLFLCSEAVCDQEMDARCCRLASLTAVASLSSKILPGDR